jgi:hypothetical protein
MLRLSRLLTLSRKAYALTLFVLVLVPIGLGLLWPSIIPQEPGWEGRITAGSQRLAAAIGTGFALGALTGPLVVLRLRDAGWRWWAYLPTMPCVALGSAWAYTQLQGNSYNAPHTGYLVLGLLGLSFVLLALLLPSSRRVLERAPL